MQKPILYQARGHDQLIGRITVCRHGECYKKIGLTHSVIISFAFRLTLAKIVHATLIDPQEFDKICGQSTT